MIRVTDTNRGSVLVIVLWASLGLVALTLTFGHSMMMSYRGADNDLAGRQAQQAIEGAIRYAQVLLTEAQTKGELPEITSYSSEAVELGEANFWYIGQPENDPSLSTPVFGLVDEASKLSLNRASAAMLELLPGMTAELAAAIVDWRDSNEDVTPSGAESETYALSRPPYAAKNARFESVEELALVHGADPLVLFGEDFNMNGVLDPNEDDGDTSLPVDNRDGRLEPGLIRYLTAFSREPNTRADGAARINVRQMSAELRTLLDEKLGTSRGAEVAQRIGTAQSSSVLHFFIQGAVTAEEQDKLVDDITTNNGEFVRGRVNVNTASEAVLACIPGIGTEKASSVFAYRQSKAQQGTSIAWIVQILGEPGAIQAGPYITGKSYQLSADVAAVGRHGRGYRRTFAVIDTSTTTPRVLYRRDLSHLGWALGPDARQQLLAQGGRR